MAISVVEATPRASALNGQTITTASFTVATGDLLVACTSADSGASASITFTLSDSGTNAWTQRAIATFATSGEAGGCAVHTCAPAAGTITVTSVTGGDGGTGAVSVLVYKVTGQNASPIGANGSGGSATNAVSPGIFTSTGAGSVAFVAATEWNELGVPTSSDLTMNGFDLATRIAGLAGYKTLGGAGAQTASLDAGGTGAAAWSWAAVEILDAGGGGGGGGFVPSPTLVVSQAVQRAAVW